MPADIGEHLHALAADADLIQELFEVIHPIGLP